MYYNARGESKRMGFFETPVYDLSDRLAATVKVRCIGFDNGHHYDYQKNPLRRTNSSNGNFPRLNFKVALTSTFTLTLGRQFVDPPT